jgi:hypothetical protein
MLYPTILVGGFKQMDYFPFHISDAILPIDFHIFQRGGATTNQNRPTIWGWFTSSNLGLIGCGS